MGLIQYHHIFIAIERSKAVAHDIRTWNNTDFAKAQEFLRNIKIVYSTPETKLTRRVQGISHATAEENTFMSGDKETNVAEYFSERYGMDILYPYGPLLITGSDAKVPAEVRKFSN